MAVAHYFGIKQPLLFVYYDTPFYAYQDKIISFAVVSYVALFYSAAKQRTVVPAALVVLGVTVLGLASINMSDALASVLQEGQSTAPYWIQTTYPRRASPEPRPCGRKNHQHRKVDTRGNQRLPGRETQSRTLSGRKILF